MAQDIDKLFSDVATLLHSEKKREAAALVADFCELGVEINSDDPKLTEPPLQYLLHWALDNGRPVQAAQMLWRPNQFNPNPQYCKDIWKLYDEATLGLLMGAASVTKSYSMGVRIFLEWIRDPEWTTVKVVGPSEGHLTANLFSHLVSLHGSASLPMPGEVGELFIGLDRRNELSCIRGVVIPVGRTKKAARLQGAKRKPRRDVHTVFGPLTRLTVFIDEVENVQAGIWSDIDNLISNHDGSNFLKIFGAYNPTDSTDEVGKRAEPKTGWENFDVDKDYRWTSKRGWEVLRLDAERCENVVTGKIVFPGLQTREGLELMARNAGGKNSPGYFSMGRGAYPPSGVQSTIIPPGMFMKMRGEFIWHSAPVPVGACDLALEGGAAAVFTKGQWGMATGIKYPPSLEHPTGRTVMFNSTGKVKPRWGLQIETQFALPKGDTVAMKDAILDVCRKAGIKPEFFALDRTGNGAGVADLIRHEWSTAIHDLNYSESATENKIMEEDTKLASELYDRVHTELWFALRAWGEFGYVLIHPQLNTEKLTEQVTQRRFSSISKKNKAESKKDYMSRGYPSPDEADSLTLTVHGVRRSTGIVLSMRGEGAVFASDDDDGFFQESRIDESNRTQYLLEA